MRQDSNKILAAIELAFQAHEGGIKSKTNRPYISHPVRVGMMMVDDKMPVEVAIAAFLHDVIEKSDFTREDIKERFGERVAYLVEECSEDESQPWKERKVKSVNHLKTAEKDVVLISCADKLDNVSAILDEYNKSGDEIWERFEEGKDNWIWYYTSVADVICTEENLKSNTGIFSKYKHLTDILKTL